MFCPKYILLLLLVTVFYEYNHCFDHTANFIHTVRPNHNLSYSIGTDFCLEHMESFQGGVFIYCQLSNSPFPAPKFNMIATRIGEDSSVELLNRMKGNIFLNKTILKPLFENETVVNVSCRVSNSFGSDEMTTLIKACGESL